MLLGKVEKTLKRVQEYVKPFRGKRMEPNISPGIQATGPVWGRAPYIPACRLAVGPLVRPQGPGHFAGKPCIDQRLNCPQAVSCQTAHGCLPEHCFLAGRRASPANESARPTPLKTWTKESC